VHITGVEETCAPEDANRFAYTQLDVTDTGAVRAYAAALPRVDILVNCAAITRRGEEMAPEFFSHVLDVRPAPGRTRISSRAWRRARPCAAGASPTT
jgi:NAD(P)-dependent dehydrogenase (short-subunit alcohol dehydrogenase family)